MLACSPTSPLQSRAEHTVVPPFARFVMRGSLLQGAEVSVCMCVVVQKAHFSSLLLSRAQTSQTTHPVPQLDPVAGTSPPHWLCSPLSLLTPAHTAWPPAAAPPHPLPPRVTCPCSFFPVVGDSPSAELNQASQFRAGFASFPSPPQVSCMTLSTHLPQAAGVVPALTLHRCLQPSRAGLLGHGATMGRGLVASHSFSMGGCLRVDTEGLKGHLAPVAGTLVLR